MPCYVAPHDFCHHGIEDVDELICDVNNLIKNFDKARKREEGEFQELKKYADKMTDMLCRVMGEIEYQSPSTILCDDINQWWAEHKKWDEERKKNG